jgi:hypothetical protein
MSLHSYLLAVFSAAVFAMEASAGFLPPVIYAVGSFSVAVGDFNGDGHLDLAVASSGVSILLGNGDDSFLTAENFGAGSIPFSMAVGDFNGDGHLDLVVFGLDNAGNSTVSIWLGNGDGSFQAAHSYPGGRLPHSLTVGDFNGDGHLDLAVSNGGGDEGEGGNVSMLLGDGYPDLGH